MLLAPSLSHSHSRSILPRGVALIVAAVAAVCVEAAFTNVSPATGIRNVHSLRSDGVNHHGGGAAADIDGDGFPDLLLAKFAAPPLLYMNQGDGTFVNEAAERGLGAAPDASGFGAGDFDNDGDVDLFVVTHKGRRHFLMMNDGTGRFTEEAVARGAALETVSPHQAYSVGLADYDLDGYLDVYVSEWGIPVGSEPERHCALLRNRGASAPGHFELATAAAGVTQIGRSGLLHGFSTGWADFDGDVWPDLALIADYGTSKLYWNNGNGGFLDTTRASGVGLEEFGMGVAVADYDRDGLIDYYATSIYDSFSQGRDGSHRGNKLYRNLGSRKFEEVAAAAGVARTGWGWGAAFFDFENDGDSDLVVTNGINLSEGGDRLSVPYVDAASDPTTLFGNNGAGGFDSLTAESGINDAAYGKGLIVWDFDRDGDEDLVIVNSFSDPIVYRNDASGNGNDWIQFTFEGTVSNRSAYGTHVSVTEGGVTQTLVFNPTNAYLGQREAVLHFGLGASGGAIDRVVVRWPTGLAQTFENLPVKQLTHLAEPADAPTPPLFAQQPTAAASYGLGESATLTVRAIGVPAPVIVWEKDGQPVAGASGTVLRIPRFSPWEAGVYRAKATSSGGVAYSAPVVIGFDIDAEAHSAARWWNEFMLEAIRKDFPNPTKHSRNLYHVSGAMWDAFWACHPEGWSRARPVFLAETIEPLSDAAEREQAATVAISHAAYGLLKARYESSPGGARSLFAFRWLMERLGCDPDDAGLAGSSPAAVGNRIARAALDFGYLDGSNELGGYADTSGYAAANQPLFVKAPGIVSSDLNRWQPLAFDFAVSQNGIPLGELTQVFLGVNWREVATFALKKPTPQSIAFDPGPPPQFGGADHEQYVAAAVEVIRYSSYLDPSDPATLDFSPGALLNNALGTNGGAGRPRNPFTNAPYAPNVVKRADYGRVLAEFWADGPASETPPGHWNALFNEVTDHPLTTRRYLGQGEPLSPLEWDIRGYLALNGGMHDAAIAAWTLKRQYDYARPITMIRGLAARGQSSDPDLPGYDPLGLPLVPGLIELVSAESAAAGERHAHLSGEIGRVAIRAWRGETADPESEFGGVDWIIGDAWLPYQRSTFVTPAFAAYVSGHSTFSRSGAEVMHLLTGSPYFPGGLAEFAFPQGDGLEFEYGPSADIALQWATYYDAADQAGLSRLYGGIHVRADDFVGRTLGARIGVEAFIKTHALRNASPSTGKLEMAAVTLPSLDGSGSPYVDFRVRGTALPIVSASTLEDAATLAYPHILFVLPPLGDADEGIAAIARSGTLEGASISGAAPTEGTPLAIAFSIMSAEPTLVFVRGIALDSSGPQVVVTLQREQDGQWENIATSADEAQADAASLCFALLLRDDPQALPLATSDAALALPLATGTYRAVATASVGHDRVRLTVSAQGWTE